MFCFYYDSGKHRLAFDESSVLIDSAPRTVVQLVDGRSVSSGNFEYTISSLGGRLGDSGGGNQQWAART